MVTIGPPGIQVLLTKPLAFKGSYLWGLHKMSFTEFPRFLVLLCGFYHGRLHNYSMQIKSQPLDVSSALRLV